MTIHGGSPFRAPDSPTKVPGRTHFAVLSLQPFDNVIPPLHASPPPQNLENGIRSQPAYVLREARTEHLENAIRATGPGSRTSAARKSQKPSTKKPHHKLSYLRRNYDFTAQRSLKRAVRAIKSMSCFMSGTISQGSRQAPRTIFPHLFLAPCNPLLSVYLSRFPSFCLLMVPACCCLSRLHTGVMTDVTL